MWFVKVVKVCLSQEDKKDDYGHPIFMATFWKKISTSTGHLSKKVTFFYKESIVYPFVQLIETKNGFQISDIDFIEILLYVEETGLSSL